MLNLIGFVILFCADIALSQEAPLFIEEGSLATMFKSWPEFGKLMAFIVGLQLILRGLAEGLTRFSDYTDTKLDNKAAAVLSEVSWFLGTLIGKVGYGTPKLVLKEAAKLPEEKSVAVEAPKA